jgi:hypothetical protein
VLNQGAHVLSKKDFLGNVIYVFPFLSTQVDHTKFSTHNRTNRGSYSICASTCSYPQRKDKP